MSESKQHEEEDPSQPHIHDMMEKLIRQQDKIITLLEQIAHSSGSKKVGETSNSEDAPEDDKTSSDEDAPDPEDDNLTGTLCYYIILYLYFLFMIYTHLF